MCMSVSETGQRSDIIMTIYQLYSAAFSKSSFMNICDLFVAIPFLSVFADDALFYLSK